MIFRLLALILLPLMAYYFARSTSQRFSLNPRQKQLLFFLIVALLLIGVLIALGRLPVQFILAPIGVGITFLLRMLPTLLRLLPMWQMFKGRTASGRAKATNQVSTIRTEFLAMELQHNDGAMDGVVLKGSYGQRRLSTLALNELMALYAECRADADSSQVLEAYIDHAFPDWREQTDNARQQGDEIQIADESVMTRALALEILGLDESASAEQISKAHRTLMQKMHPDRGGTDYLAKKINIAKDFLMKEGKG
jgi:hypothetical protein